MKTKCILAIVAVCAAALIIGCANFHVVPMTVEISGGGAPHPRNAHPWGVRPFVPRGAERRAQGVPLQYHLSNGIRMTLQADPPPPRQWIDSRGRVRTMEQRVQRTVTFTSDQMGAVPPDFRNLPNVVPVMDFEGRETTGPALVFEEDEMGREGYRLVIYVVFDTRPDEQGNLASLRFVTRVFPSADMIPLNEKFFLHFYDLRNGIVQYGMEGHRFPYRVEVYAGDNRWEQRITMQNRPHLNYRRHGRAREDVRERRARGWRI